MTREEIKALLARAGNIETVEVGALKIEVVELSFAKKIELSKIEGGGEELMRHALKAACYVPGTIEPMLDDELISVMPQGAVVALFDAVKRVSGMTAAEALEPDPEIEQGITEPSEAEKNG
jgi:hypothetical protein